MDEIFSIFDHIDNSTFKDLMRFNRKRPGAKDLTIVINSYGGEIFAAQQIMNVMKNYNTTVYVDGVAASAAAVIALSANVVYMTRNSYLLLHSVQNVQDIQMRRRLNSQFSAFIKRFDARPYFDTDDPDKEYLFGATDCINREWIDGIKEFNEYNLITAERKVLPALARQRTLMDIVRR